MKREVFSKQRTKKAYNKIRLRIIGGADLAQIYLSELSFCLGKRYSADGIAVMGLACDSRRCKSGYLFFCKGENFKTEYALEAKKRGACAFVCEAPLARRINLSIDPEKIITVENVMVAMARCAEYFYGYPMKRLVSVAVTGTKGKTTTVHYINSAINMQNGMKSAVLSELVSDDAPRLTTPEPIDLHAAAARAISDGCTHIVCEISSQAQKLSRTYGITFDIGCFLNLGIDHISPSEHASIEEYFECKRSLFDKCKAAVVNTDDPYGKILYGTLPKGCRRVSVSVLSGDADYYAENIQTDGYGCDLSVCIRKNGSRVPILVTALGEHNAVNAISASALLKELGISDEAIFFGIASGEPSGRGEIICSRDKRVTVIVDYAHNEMSFEAMFKMAKREFAGATVTVIFGCPGGKAYCRRRQLAQLCADNADKVTVCEDDSGNEGYDSISREMQGYFEGLDGTRLKKGAVSYIESRELALRAALDNAAECGGRHLILMLGKGDEALNRTCGCDEACVPDTEIARNEISRFDTRIAALGTLKDSAQLGALTVCLEDEALADTIAFSYSMLFRNKKSNIFVVCEPKTADLLAKKCFSQGIATLIINEQEACASLGKAIKKGIVSQRMEILPIFTCVKSIKRYSVKIATACKAEELVYLTLGQGILMNRNIAAKKLSYRRAMLISRLFQEEELQNAETALRFGVKNVAYIDGTGIDSLVRYLQTDSYDGIAICGE